MVWRRKTKKSIKRLTDNPSKKKELSISLGGWP
jgi:hypothetical protein